METEWVLARIQLHQLMQRHPTWSNQRYADCFVSELHGQRRGVN